MSSYCPVNENRFRLSVVSINSKSDVIRVDCPFRYDYVSRAIFVDLQSGDIIGGEVYDNSWAYNSTSFFIEHPIERFHTSFQHSFRDNNINNSDFVSSNAQLRFRRSYNSTHEFVNVQNIYGGDALVEFNRAKIGYVDQIQPFDDNNGAIILHRTDERSGTLNHLNLNSGLISPLSLTIPTDAVMRMPASGSYLFLGGGDYSGFSFTIYERDFDGDGFGDSMDHCVQDSGPLQGCPDTDGDGVGDANDSCPNTSEGLSVNEEGCASVQRDSDADGVNDRDDLCPDSTHSNVNVRGCTPEQADEDNDGVADAFDNCSQTKATETADQYGCAPSQQSDTDGDGVTDMYDTCENSTLSDLVNNDGCDPKQLDADQDGVVDFSDFCPNTQNQIVDQDGCDASQRDSDEDGVNDELDRCPNSGTADAVDADGCSYLQIDDDADGIPNVADLCPNTDNTTVASENGCGDGEEPTQSDVDKDGLVDIWDFCDETPNEEVADLRGCSPSQLDDDGDGISNAADECPEFSDKDRLLPNGCEDTSLILGLSPNSFLMVVMVLMLGGYLSFHYIRHRRGI